jgi:hypothetical protein
VRRRTLAALAVIATALTCLSAAYQRVGPRRMVTGEAWCSTPAPCAIPALGAGFPLPWLVDNPQISVPNAVGLFEDDFRAGAFLIDALFWFALAAITVLIIQRVRSRRSASARGGE